MRGGGGGGGGGGSGKDLSKQVGQQGCATTKN